MGEGRAILAGSRNTVRTMATRDIYETGFDEDIRTESSANQCPECDGRVTTNAVETVCEDCGLVIDEQRIDHGPEWRAHDDEECERTGAPLTAVRHDRGLSTEIGRGTDAKGNEISGQKRRRLARMRREQTRGRWRSKTTESRPRTGRSAQAGECPRTLRFGSGSDVPTVPERSDRRSALRPINRGDSGSKHLRSLSL
jgi:hypothetical protein